ncbi:MAG: BREX system serine/threonine kinase PglW [Xenococcaceae cyanobacterium]
MDNNLSNWIRVSESRFPWEREALEFIRQQFPSHSPYLAWSNFEFIANDGSINEVDLLVFTPQGFFLIEIKSRPGRLTGDAGTWTWRTSDNKVLTTDNPLIATNNKAKKLKSLLEAQKACRKKERLPFIEALIFCSAPDLQVDLSGTASYRICSRSGIMAAITRRECPGLRPQPIGNHNRPMVKMISQAMEQAGIRQSQSYRRVSDYKLENLIEEGINYQDWSASHVKISKIRRRIRLYLLDKKTTSAERSMLERAAKREFQLIETLDHPSILRTYGYTEYELGPAVILEHDPHYLRLDHYLAQAKDTLNVGLRIDLMRQITEAICFAHQNKVVHRGLCPQSILVNASNINHPKIKIFNWQIAHQSLTTASTSITSNIDNLVDDVSTAYIAPEALANEAIVGEYLDVFSLGAIAFYLFSGQPPASNGLELSQKLRTTKGLQISSVLNGAPESLQELIQYSTHPEIINRIEVARDFLSYLDEVEAELTTPEGIFVEDPTLAQQEDILPGNFRVIKRLGQGSSSVVFLVERDGKEYVLKVANDSEHNQRLQDELEVLQKLRHPNIVESYESKSINNHFTILLRPVFVNKEKRKVETLAQRLRKEGRLHIDLLQRFGEDLLDVVKHLEEQGIAHRDIKPDNIAIGQIGQIDRLHLVLFDFSLSRTPTDNVRAGTKGYLDPLLTLRNPPVWDLDAERYAAAVTLYEMATGTLPVWGDGITEPSFLDNSCEISLEPELFDASLRDDLTSFFSQSFRRDPNQRFDNGEEMLRVWRNCFEDIEEPGTLSDRENESELRELLAHATVKTAIAELGLGTRAINALDRNNILTVSDLLSTPRSKLNRLRGVGNSTRREIALAFKILTESLQDSLEWELTSEEDNSLIVNVDLNKLSIDLLFQKITRSFTKEEADVQNIINSFLGLNAIRDSSEDNIFPSQSELIDCLDFSRDLIIQSITKYQKRWSEPAITKLRETLAEILQAAEGVMSLTELTDAILLARGSVQDEPKRSQFAQAVLRVGVEVESTLKNPRFLVYRKEQGHSFPGLKSQGLRVTAFRGILIASTSELAHYGYQLGEVADKLAASDPLLSPAKAIQQLRDIPTNIETLSDTRLLRLAAAASTHAAISSRQELYPRNMDGSRALKLSQGALFGVHNLTIEQIRDRVRSRYPEAAPLPSRPLLDRLLQEANLDLTWDNGSKSYVNSLQIKPLITSSTSLARLAIGSNGAETAIIAPEIADARQFEEKLQRGLTRGSFFALMVNPRYYQRAYQELSARFDIELVDFEGLFIDALRQVAQKANVNWDLVLQTDARPHQGDWDKLMLLVNRTMPLVEAQLTAINKTILLIYPGLLARYNQMTLLERLRDKIGHPDGITGLWILIPGEREAAIERQAVPLLSPGQRSIIPESWLCSQYVER